MDVELVEVMVYVLALDFYPDYPDPMPEFQYLGGDYGRGRLESALRNPAQTYDGRFVYRTTHDKAAILLWSIITNHPFVDGNKRMGLTATHVFMMNGYLLYASRHDAVEVCLRIAGAGRPIDLREVRRWLFEHSISVNRVSSMRAGEFVDWVESIGEFTEFVGWADNVEDNIAFLRQRFGGTS